MKILKQSQSYGVNTISKLNIQKGIIPQDCRWSNALILCISSDVASYLFKEYENFFDSLKF